MLRNKKEFDMETVKKSFAIQAANFESSSMNFSKEEYLDDTVSAIGVSANDTILEVAAGTCACGRALAGHAKAVVCLDVTSAMLEVGKKEAARKQQHKGESL